MRNLLPSISTRTEAFTPRELSLSPTPEPPRPEPLPEPRADRADHIKEALRRWLEEEL
jgi:hypothetical protein